MARRSFARSRKCSRPAWTVTSSSASRSWNTSATDADTWKRGGFEPRSGLRGRTDRTSPALGRGDADESDVFGPVAGVAGDRQPTQDRSEEHTSELQSLMRISYAVFCLKNKNKRHNISYQP